MKKSINSNIPFIKMQGLGNDFVLIDARIDSSSEKKFNISSINQKFIQKIADRRYGVGCDQVLILTEAKDTIKYNINLPKPYISFSIFNPDASKAQACGNGTRCIARYLYDNDKNLINYNKALLLEVEGQVLVVQKISERNFQVEMGKPKFEPSDLELTKNCDSENLPIAIGEYKNPFGVSIGNPHAVFFSQNDDEKLLRDINILGEKLENNTIFKQRANISFARIEATDKVTLFVWERGAGNTLACGSAACATVVAGIKKGWLKKNVNVKMQGGELNIEWRAMDNKSDSVILMTGAADYSFYGNFNL